MIAAAGITAFVSGAVTILLGLFLLPVLAVLALAALRYRAICKRDAQRVRSAEAQIQQAAIDLDDWLASEEPLEEFKVWKRPEARTSSAAGEQGSA